MLFSCPAFSSSAVAFHDPGLEKAIEIVLAALAKNAVPKPKKPAYPTNHKKAPRPTTQDRLQR